LTQPIKVKTGVQQGCPLSLSLLNIYINQIITEWKEEMKGINVSRKKVVKKPPFADGKVIVADSENALQVSIRSLETVTSTYGLKISADSENSGFYQKRSSEK